MSTSYKSVVLVGASGNIGRLTLSIFEASDLEVTAVIRLTSKAIFPGDITVAKTEFNLESLTRIFKGKDAMISMIPVVSLDTQAVVIEAALTAGVKRFIPSEYGSDTSNDEVIAAVLFFGAKRKQLDYLRSTQDVMSWIALTTGPLFDWGLPLGFWGFDLEDRRARLVDGGRTKFTASNGDQVGRALMATLARPEETANQVVSVESFNTTQLDVLGALEKQTGSKWQVSNVSADDVRADAQKLFGQGDIVGGGSKLIEALVFGETGLEDHTDLDTAKWNRLLKLPEQSVEDTIQRVLKAQP
ncbi:isoflavone reductase family [Fusarium albosuccineum]|uniref:Isoflavone reductase family n=1 Tax=Fusarium albosuccineum TaxID=1237068 RepID=A0A8H4LFF8_9HYPO|nr:isoflavone reductase family [Fusarium albosuccineum]